MEDDPCLRNHVGRLLRRQLGVEFMPLLEAVQWLWCHGKHALQCVGRRTISVSSAYEQAKKRPQKHFAQFHCLSSLLMQHS
jgi:hypothetical protein